MTLFVIVTSKTSIIIPLLCLLAKTVDTKNTLKQFLAVCLSVSLFFISILITSAYKYDMNTTKAVHTDTRFPSHPRRYNSFV